MVIADLDIEGAERVARSLPTGEAAAVDVADEASLVGLIDRVEDRFRPVLLTNLGVLAYAVSKHAAVAIAEWIAITYGEPGIRTSCFCPQAVDTPELRAVLDQPLSGSMLEAGDLLTPDEVGTIAVDGVQRDEFLILSHPVVGEYMRHRAEDHPRWLRGMRRAQARVEAAALGGSRPAR